VVVGAAELTREVLEQVLVEPVATTVSTVPMWPQACFCDDGVTWTLARCIPNAGWFFDGTCPGDCSLEDIAF
jgi:hypothetical protein